MNEAEYSRLDSLVQVALTQLEAATDAYQEASWKMAQARAAFEEASAAKHRFIDATLDRWKTGASKSCA